MPGDYCGVLPHAGCSCHDFRPPPPLASLADETMLAVASGYGKVREQWRPVAIGTWIAWPHADGAWINAEEKTAAQVRADLAAQGRG